MIYVGKNVNIKPTYEGGANDKPMPGRVIYIHPENRYYCAEFETQKGKFRECFPCPAEMRRKKNAVDKPKRGLHYGPRKRTGATK